MHRRHYDVETPLSFMLSRTGNGAFNVNKQREIPLYDHLHALTESSSLLRSLVDQLIPALAVRATEIETCKAMIEEEVAQSVRAGTTNRSVKQCDLTSTLWEQHKLRSSLDFVDVVRYSVEVMLCCLVAQPLNDNMTDPRPDCGPLYTSDSLLMKRTWKRS